MASITVLGPNGLVGRRLLPLLQEAGISAKSAGRSNSDAFFDWSDPTTFRSALADTSALYLVPPAMVASPAPQVERLLGIAKDIGIRRVVAVSSLGITFPASVRPGRSPRVSAAMAADAISPVSTIATFPKPAAEGTAPAR